MEEDWRIFWVIDGHPCYDSQSIGTLENMALGCNGLPDPRCQPAEGGKGPALHLSWSSAGIRELIGGARRDSNPEPKDQVSASFDAPWTMSSPTFLFGGDGVVAVIKGAPPSLVSTPSSGVPPARLGVAMPKAKVSPNFPRIQRRFPNRCHMLMSPSALTVELRARFQKNYPKMANG